MNSGRTGPWILLVLWVVTGCASRVLPKSRVPGLAEEFVGTTPCDSRSPEFVGGLATNASCHCVTWHFSFFTNQQANVPGKFELVALYGLPGRNDPNQIETGPTVKLEGRLEIVRGSTAGNRAKVYRIVGRNERALHLVQLGEHLLHFSDEQKRLTIGNAGWSYTLNRKGIGHED